MNTVTMPKGVRKIVFEPEYTTYLPHPLSNEYDHGQKKVLFSGRTIVTITSMRGETRRFYLSKQQAKTLDQYLMSIMNPRQDD